MGKWRQGDDASHKERKLSWTSEEEVGLEPFVTRKWDVDERPRFHSHKGRKLGLYTEGVGRSPGRTAWGTDSLSDRVSTVMSQL